MPKFIPMQIAVIIPPIAAKLGLRVEFGYPGRRSLTDDLAPRRGKERKLHFILILDELG